MLNGLNCYFKRHVYKTNNTRCHSLNQYLEMDSDTDTDDDFSGDAD